MEIGVIGLGKMGGGIARRLSKEGHRIVGLDRDPATAVHGFERAEDLSDLLSRLMPPRVVWLMLPAGEPTAQTVEALADEMSEGDVIVDGGNSRYSDSIRRADELKARGIGFVDVGVSGGVHGEHEGYCLMAGGGETTIEHLQPLFEALAPSPERGWGRVGPSGAGHFVKMIHNGIEYGMMQAFAEGFAILDEKKDLVEDPSTAAEIWQSGSVIRSWLLDLVVEILRSGRVDEIAPYVSDSGEGRWTVAEAIDLNVSAPVITLSLLQRLRSRDENSYADRILAALREGFGGHDVK